MKRVGDLLKMIERRCPPGTAEDWDNVGLLAGDLNWRTRGATVSIDLTEQALELATRRGHRLIVNHHPCIFPRQKGLGRVVAAGGGASSALVFEAVRRGIAVIAAHTNFDRCALEVAAAVSKGLGVTPRGRLIDDGAGALRKLAVFVPESHLEKVRAALFAAGAGQIGNYDECSFGAEGMGTFRGLDGTRPFVGRPGRRETAREVRLETVLPHGLERPVLEALRAAHPYEEIAYDLLPIEQEPSGVGLVRGLGYGFWGDLARPRPFAEVARQVKRMFGVPGFILTDPAPRRVRRIGFVAGKGASFTAAAARAGCDLFITGEAGYHVALDGARRGLAVMELGHRESERYYLRVMRDWLRAEGVAAVELNRPVQRVHAR